MSPFAAADSAVLRLHTEKKLVMLENGTSQKQGNKSLTESVNEGTMKTMLFSSVEVQENDEHCHTLPWKNLPPPLLLQ